jgi:hypothetical protein
VVGKLDGLSEFEVRWPRTPAGDNLPSTDPVFWAAARPHRL